MSDYKLLISCLELSWAGIFLSQFSTLLGEPLTSVIARLGIYTKNHPKDPRLVRLVVPLYLIRYLNPTAKSLIAISEHEDSASRLECGFRRVLHMRFSLLDPNSWSDVGLPFLGQCGAPYPSDKFKSSYPFPKISQQCEKYSQNALLKFMQNVHDGDFSAQRQVTFPQEAMSMLYESMKIGQYYQPLPKSGSADAKIRLRDNIMLDIQFKNQIKAFTLPQLIDEARKSVVESDGWTVYLLIVCSSGHDIEDKESLKVGHDLIEMHSGVHCIVLSEESVARFFGIHGIDGIKGGSLLFDTATRLNF